MVLLDREPLRRGHKRRQAPRRQSFITVGAALMTSIARLFQRKYTDELISEEMGQFINSVGN